MKKAATPAQGIGKLGIEKAYEDTLLGQVGVERVETSARGQIMRSVDREDLTPGADIPLHLDIGLTAKLYDVLGDKRGAIVAIDPMNGGILGLASAPTYDANSFIGGISQAEYSALQVDRDTPLFNRALRGQYPPGSTIKPMIGLVGLHYGAVSWKSEYFSRGFQLPGRITNIATGRSGATVGLIWTRPSSSHAIHTFTICLFDSGLTKCRRYEALWIRTSARS